jgi:hypothetical protein
MPEKGKCRSNEDILRHFRGLERCDKHFAEPVLSISISFQLSEVNIKRKMLEWHLLLQLLLSSHLLHQ